MQLQHLFEALSPMFCISLLVGTSPIYAQANNGKHYLKISNIFKMVTLLYIAIYTCSLVYGLNNMDYKTSIAYFGNAMSSIGLALDSVGQIFLIYIIYIFTFIIPSNIKNLINKIATIDSVFDELGYKSNYNKTFWEQVILLFVGISTLAVTAVSQLYLLTSSSSFHLSETLWFIYYFPVFIIFVMECQFSFMVYLIYQRFQTINEILNQMSTNANNKPAADVQMVKAKESQTPTILRKVETLMQIHDSLVDIANELNTNYSLQILLCLTKLFIKSVFSVFFAYFELFINGKALNSINWFIWGAINWCELLLITTTCHLATGQAQQIGVEVHKLLLYSDENIIRDKLIVFSQQVFHRPVDFTACGLFSIQAELLFTVLGSATTYLLIMLQFQEGNEANCIIANSTVL